MTTISNNEAYCALKEEQKIEHTALCIPPSTLPDSRKKDDSLEYVEINVCKLL